MSAPVPLLTLTLPPLGRLMVAAAETAGRLPGPGLIIAVEQKDAMGAVSMAGLLDRERVQKVRDCLDRWLEASDPQPQPEPEPATAVDRILAPYRARGAQP
jgi:hypothetical protein